MQQKRFGTAKARCTASGASTSRQTLNYTHRLLPKLLPLRCLLPCSPMTVTHCLPLAAAAMLACRLQLADPCVHLLLSIGRRSRASPSRAPRTIKGTTIKALKQINGTSARAPCPTTPNGKASIDAILKGTYSDATLIKSNSRVSGCAHVTVCPILARPRHDPGAIWRPYIRPNTQISTCMKYVLSLIHVY